MNSLLGEYTCRLDAKGRVAVPAGLLRQLAAADGGRFVVNRGFEQHLVLYPISAWQRISSEVNKLNQYVRKNRQFIRYFFRGANELKLDSHNRLLLPRRLLEYAAIDEQVVLFAFGDRIEIWAGHLYDQLLDDEPDNFADLAEEIMGDRDLATRRFTPPLAPEDG